MAITALPTPPSRQDPTNFNDRADAFLGALPQFQTEANTLQTDVNAKQVAAATSATNAAASELAAANTAGATIWVSGTTYAVGANRFSPINYLTYRRKTAGAGTTDPSLDATNWQLLTGLGNTTLEAVYPIGSIYINAASYTNPAALFGFGTWVAFGTGRVMVGFDGLDPVFDNLGDIGGSKDATLVSHSHSITVDANGQHQHYVGSSDSGTNPGSTSGLREFVNNYGEGNGLATYTSFEGYHTHSASASTAGASATNANLPPYITVAMWRRTA